MQPIRSYDYVGLIKHYFAQSKSSGRTAKLAGTKQYRMSFNGTKLYSYESQLAELDVANNVLLVDYRISKCSNTSVKHTRYLKTFCPSNIQVYYIPLSNSPEQNLQLYWERLDTLIGKCIRARTDSSKISYKSQIKQVFNAAMPYAKYAKIDEQSTLYLKYLEYTTKLFELKLL